MSHKLQRMCYLGASVRVLRNFKFIYLSGQVTVQHIHQRACNCVM